MALLVLNRIRICFMLFIACLVEVVWEVVSSGWECVDAAICPRDFFGCLEERLSWLRIVVVVLPHPREYTNGELKSNNVQITWRPEYETLVVQERPTETETARIARANCSLTPSCPTRRRWRCYRL